LVGDRDDIGSADDHDGGLQKVCLSGLVTGVLEELEQKPAVVVRADVLRQVGDLPVLLFARCQVAEENEQAIGPEFPQVEHKHPPESCGRLVPC
jgi:hypothetical protein